MKTCVSVSVSAPLQEIDKAMVNRIGEVRLTVHCTSLFYFHYASCVKIVNFVHMLAPKLMVQLAKLDQYIGAIDMAAPIYWWTVTVTPLGEETKHPVKFKILWIYLCMQHLFVQDVLQHQYIGVIQRESKCQPHRDYLFKHWLFYWLEWSGNRNTCFQDGSQIQRQNNVNYHNGTPVVSICHLSAPLIS